MASCVLISPSFCKRIASLVELIRSCPCIPTAAKSAAIDAVSFTAIPKPEANSLDKPKT